MTVGSEVEEKTTEGNRWVSFLLARGKHIIFPYADVRKDRAQEPCGEIKQSHRLQARHLNACPLKSITHALGRTLFLIQ